MQKFLACMGIMLVMAACHKQEAPLFRLLSPEKTGLTFRNDIFENEEYNILKFSYLYNGGGVSIGDFDNNGLPDIFFTGNMVNNSLYLNQGKMKFRDVTEVAGVGGAGKWMYGSATVDINADGWLDIYVCASMAGHEEDRRNALYVNQGLNKDGIPVFKDEAKQYGIDDSGYSSHAVFLDYDRDNDLDLFILSNTKVEGIPTVYRPKLNDGSSDNTDRLYRNNGDGTFTNVSDEVGIRKEGFGLGVAVLDINQDGYPDIYVGNDFITNDLLYVNEGGEQFSDRIDEMIRHQSRFSMGNDVADINNDGHPDIITLDMLPESNLRKKTVVGNGGYIIYINDFKYGYTHQYVRNMLQLNNGNMSFSEIGQLAGVHQTEWSWSAHFADFDNDGFRDLFITNGFPKDITDSDFISFRKKSGSFTTWDQLIAEIPSVKIPNYVFKNQGDLTFTDVSKAWGITQPSFSNGAAFADFDLDGDLDYVVNNIDDPAFLYENTLSDSKKNKAHYLRVKLQGPPGNWAGLGAKIYIYYGQGKMQYHEQNIYRGYVSTVEEIAHFGLNGYSQVDSLLLIWPDGRETKVEHIAADQVLKLKWADAQPPTGTRPPVQQTAPPLLKDVTAETGINYLHQEQDFIDYNIQRNIPHKFSQYGPSMAVGDVNGDQLEDLFLGGAKDFEGQIYLQRSDGTFQLAPAPFAGGSGRESEDMGALFFDADADGDQDLYVVSGSFEFPEGSEQLQDRLLLNDGRGHFSPAPQALPEVKTSGSCVRAADYDADGDLDLFVGGRVVVGAYPLAPRSYVLNNQNGVFKDVTEQVSPELAALGMVTDAVWSDFNGDGAVDLVVAGEFMPITFFANQGGKLLRHEQTNISHLSGWWNSLIAADFDQDGDMDYIGGNVGENNFYCATTERPVRVTAGDFDQNGAIDAILSCYLKAEDGSMQPFPIHSWPELYAQSPIFRARFDKYETYGRTTMEGLLTEEELKEALVLEATHMATSYIENKGDGTFNIKKLPLEAQFAPVNGMLATDVNQDGYTDVLMVGNDYGNEVNMGQYDAFVGLVLLGDGKGNFTPVSGARSGFFVHGDAKALVWLPGPAGSQRVLASQNRGPLKAFSLQSQNLRPLYPQPLDFSATLYYEDGRVERRELHYGEGFLSQPSRVLMLQPGVTRVELTDFAGNTRTEAALVN
ncbi:MAG: hypothetical protein D6730_10275 [Bacteroidetes bacterium]|nr:MAG: hypothetical protein D6730_10275 [Bacteroidota bacterium]